MNSAENRSRLRLTAWLRAVTYFANGTLQRDRSRLRIVQIEPYVPHRALWTLDRFTSVVRHFTDPHIRNTPQALLRRIPDCRRCSSFPKLQLTIEHQRWGPICYMSKGRLPQR